MRTRSVGTKFFCKAKSSYRNHGVRRFEKRYGALPRSKRVVFRTTDVSKYLCAAAFGVEIRDMSKLDEFQSICRLLASFTMIGRLVWKLPIEPVLVKPRGSPLE